MIATVAVIAEKKIDKRFSNRSDYKETIFQQS